MLIHFLRENYIYKLCHVKSQVDDFVCIITAYHALLSHIRLVIGLHLPSQWIFLEN